MRRLVVDCGAADTRAALVEDAAIIRFWFGPARGDERLPRPPATGDLFLARVRAVSRPLGAFLDIGEDCEALLSVKTGEAAPVEGEAHVVVVRRPPIGTKGPLVSRDWRKGLGRARIVEIEGAARHATAPCSLAGGCDPALAAFAALGRPNALVVANDSNTANLLRANGVAAAKIEASPFERFGGEDALAAALARACALPSGAQMTFDETEALTAVDVDTGPAADGAVGRLNDRVNTEAAARLFDELSRRAIGGRIVVDFLPPSSAAARADLLAQLRKRAAGFDGRLGRLSADGLFDLAVPRRSLSLLQQASEPGAAEQLRRGRRLTLDWTAKSALRALETRLGARPSARLRLLAGAAIADYLRERRPQWTERLASRYGARFAIESDPGLEERDFDVAE